PVTQSCAGRPALTPVQVAGRRRLGAVMHPKRGPVPERGPAGAPCLGAMTPAKCFRYGVWPAGLTVASINIDLGEDIMTRLKVRLVSSAALIFATALAGSVQAQESAALEEVVVTAQKRAENVQ